MLERETFGLAGNWASGASHLGIEGVAHLLAPAGARLQAAEARPLAGSAGGLARLSDAPQICSPLERRPVWWT